MKPSAIILDFDGVILESVDVKTRAFRSLFSFSSQHVDEIVRFHIENGGMSRFDKFDHIYKNILQQPLTVQKREELSDMFSSLVFERILSSPFVPGSLEFMEKVSQRIPLFIVSATPVDELVAIVKQRGLMPFFKGIYGSPKKKVDCIRDIIKLTRFPHRDIIFVGDAVNDMMAAREAEVRFIGRIGQHAPDTFSGSPYPEATIRDLSELTRYLEGKT